MVLAATFMDILNSAAHRRYSSDFVYVNVGVGARAQVCQVIVTDVMLELGASPSMSTPSFGLVYKKLRNSLGKTNHSLV